jgi:hypothetical protein
MEGVHEMLKNLERRDYFVWLLSVCSHVESLSEEVATPFLKKVEIEAEISHEPHEQAVATPVVEEAGIRVEEGPNKSTGLPRQGYIAANQANIGAGNGIRV